MKKNTYFIISSIFIILIAVLAICFMDSIMEVEQRQYEALAEQNPTYESLVDLANNGNLGKINICVSFLHILLGIYMLRSAQKNLLLVNKGKIIAASLVCLLTCVLSYTAIFAIINVIVLLACKRKNPEDYPSKEKLPLPENAPCPMAKSEIILALTLVLLYVLQSFLDYLIPKDISDTALLWLGILCYATFFILAIACLATIFKKDILLFFKNTKAYVQHTLPLMGFMYLVYFGVMFLLITIIEDISSMNQALLEELPLFISAPLAIIWAPIVEETIFRGILHKCIKNNTLFIIASGLIFGIIHTIGEATLIDVLSLSVPYVILGVFLAYIYTKTSNISNNILVHAFHNTIGVIVLALSKA